MRAVFESLSGKTENPYPQGDAGCQAEEAGHGEGAAEGGQEALQESARGVTRCK